jgi:hypothetical protein
MRTPSSFAATAVFVGTLSVALADIARAQDSTRVRRDSVEVLSPNIKDPNLATVIGLMVDGGGQIYAGRPVKGFGLLAIGTGSVIWGFASIRPAECNLSTCTDVGLGPAYLGLAAYTATWLYGWATAYGDARDHNAQLMHSAVRPAIQLGHGRLGFGVAITP